MENRESNQISSNQYQERVQAQDVKLLKQSKKLFDDHVLLCPYGQDAQYFCNEGCPRSALICNSQGCKCQKSHKNCTIVNIQSINKNITQNYQKNYILGKQTLLNSFSDIIQKMIDNLSDWRIKIQNKFQVFGLTKLQIQYVSIWNQSRSNKITHEEVNQVLTGKFMNRIQKDKQRNRKAELKDATKNYNDQVGELKDLMMQGIRQLQEKQKDLQSVLFPNFFTKSEIIESFMDQERLLKMLPKIQKISQFFVFGQGSKFGTYTSSMNSSIQANKIYPNVLILVKNQFNKVIGAFARCKFKNYYGQKSQRPQVLLQKNQHQEFIFSLDLNRKAKIKSQKFAFTQPHTCFTRVKQSNQSQTIKLAFFNQSNPKNFIIGPNREITFQGGDYIEQFQGLTSFQLLGVDEEIKQKSHAQVIQIYHLTYEKNMLNETIKPKSLFSSSNIFGNS